VLLFNWSFFVRFPLLEKSRGSGLQEQGQAFRLDVVDVVPKEKVDPPDLVVQELLQQLQGDVAMGQCTHFSQESAAPSTVDSATTAAIASRL
jgi:hypothetical protein